jgi:serine/threonine protein kinase
MGTPTTEDFTAMNPGYKPLKKLPKCVKAPMETLFPKETESTAFDLLNECLVYDPKKRLTALQAMAHPFFDELREENLVFPTGNCLPDIFCFTPFELDEAEPAIVEQIIPEWYLERKRLGELNRK